MKIKLWQILFFITVFVGTTFAVFPTQRRLATFYIESGFVGKARGVVNGLLTENSADCALLRLSSDLYQREGLPLESIRDLGKAITGKCPDADLLKDLARRFELNRDPATAIAIWQIVAEKNQDDTEIIEKLINHFRYVNEPAKEAAAITRLIESEERRGRGQGPNSLLLAMLNRVLGELSAESRQKPGDPLRDVTLSDLFLLRTEYLRDLAARDERHLPGDSDEAAMVSRSLDVLLRNNRFEEAKIFVVELDRQAGGGPANLLRLVEMVRWGGNHQQVLARLDELEPLVPAGNEQILKARAEISRETGDLATAVKMYGELLQRWPEESVYKEALADLCLESGESSRAFNLYRELALTDREDNDYSGKMLAAAQQTNTPQVMAEALHFLEKQAGGNRQLAEKMIEVAGYTGNDGIINEATRILLASYPRDHALAEKAAEMFLWADRPEKAYALRKTMAIWSKGSVQDVVKMINSAEGADRPELLRDAVRVARSLWPSDSGLLLKIAESYVALGDEARAIAAYEEYLHDSPADEATERRLAELYLSAERLDDADLLYRKLYGRHPHDADLEARLIDIARWRARPQEAAAMLASIATAEPGNFDKMLAAADAGIEADELENAILFMEKALLLRPERNDLRKRLAIYYAWSGRIDKMILELEQLAGFNLLNQDEKLLLGQAYFDQKQEAKAIDVLEPFRAGESLPVEAGRVLAAAYERTGNDDAVLAVCTRLSLENPADVELHAHLGDQALAIGRTPAAEKFYAVVLAREPENVRALKGLGLIAAMNNQPERALSLFKRLTDLSPVDYEVRFQLAELYSEMGRHDESDREYRKSLQLIEQVKMMREDIADQQRPRKLLASKRIPE